MKLQMFSTSGSIFLSFCLSIPAQTGPTNRSISRIPGDGKAMTYTNFLPFAPEEVPEAEAAIRTLQATHDDVKNITWYNTPYNTYGAYIRLYIGCFPSGDAILRLKMRYWGPDWIFTERFLVRAGDELITIEPSNELDREVETGHVLETYDEPAKYNLNAIAKMVESKECTVRFEGKNTYLDYHITESDRNQMCKAILAYRYFSADASVREQGKKEAASNQAAAVAAAAQAQADKNRALLAPALKYYQGLADQGDAFGQFRMGEFYRDGDAVAKDLAKAKDYFTRSAAQGNQAASLALARLNAAGP